MPRVHKAYAYQRSPQSARKLKPRACLRCDRRFLSEGPHNRLCQACRDFLASGSAPLEEYSLGWF